MRHLAKAGVFALVCSFLLSGCGPSEPVVRGRVTYKDQPLTSGEVRFFPSSGPSRSALINAEGMYEIKNAPEGDVRIAVISQKSAGTPVGPKASVKKPAADAAPLERPKSAIPEKYNDPKTSGLTYTVTQGAQSHDIELKD